MNNESAMVAATNKTSLIRHPLLLVLAPLAITVVAGIAMIITSIESGAIDQLPGEYAKTGKVIALNAEAHGRSRELAPLASARIDPSRVLNFEIPEQQTDALVAHLVHPTQAHKDVRVTLTRGVGGFSAMLPEEVPTRGELHVYPEDLSWRLVAPLAGAGEMTFAASRR